MSQIMNMYFRRIVSTIFPVIPILFLNVAAVLAQNQKKPNIIIYLTDDIGWGDVGCYGNSVISTPNIDKLAGKGLKFENAYVTTSSCSPSRCSLITGRYPHNTGAPELHDLLPQSQVLFPKLLKESGYYTALSGKHHMGPSADAGFDLISKGKGVGGQEDWLSILQNAPENKPFFFWFASKDAHRDWQITDLARTYSPDEIVVPPMLYNGPLTREDYTGYYHEISRADHYLGLLVKELEKKGMLDNTYIIFMSDNGSPFPRNKTRLYDSGVKIPFIISGPDIKKGISKSLLSTIDVAPTLLELAGLKPDPAMQGVSFYKTLQKPTISVRDFVFTEHNWHVYQAHERMVRYKDWVYICNAFPQNRNLSVESNNAFPAGKELWEAEAKGLTSQNQKDVFLKPRPAEELYHLPSDPHQFKNVADNKANAKMLAFLSKTLDAWIAETGDSVPGNPSPDKVDENNKPLQKKWVTGEKAGASKNAQQVNKPGPIRYNGGL